jgi:hypothetical protein
LLLFVPAVQIYFISCIDALICACFTATIYFFLHERRELRYLGAASFLALSMFLTFAAVFLWLVLAAYDVIVRKSPRSFVAVAVPVVLGYVLLGHLAHFNWFEAFTSATARENPGGFSLFHNPGSYAFTRLEGIAEIMLFGSPLLLIASWQGLSSSRHKARELWWLSVLGIGTLLLMLASGAFKTGETARACLFIYPFIIWPVAVLADRAPTFGMAKQQALFTTLVIQTLFMQLFGNYYW